MKKVLSVLLCAALAFAVPCSANARETPQTGAEAFVLYCVESEGIILSKNENKRMKPASTTKLMTILLTLEQAAQNDRVITFTREMEAEGSSMYLEAGEKLRLSDLAVGMMMCSGNDAANAAAISIAGSVKKCSNLMNARARKLGMEHTHFVTPSGLDDPEHYTTARDMALLMAEGLKNKAFADLTSQKSAGVGFIEPSDKSVTYSNHNRLLSLYKDCIGGKTGYTTAAGRCLVSAARRGGVTLVCVTLNDKTDWNDHISLFDYGFDKLKAYGGDVDIDLHVVGGDRKTVKVTEKSGCAVVLDKSAPEPKRKIYLDNFVYAPVKKGEQLGRVDYYIDGKTVKSVPIMARENVFNAEFGMRNSELSS